MGELEIYEDAQGRKPFVLWMTALKDHQTRVQINARLVRFELGHLGDFKMLGEGIHELRLDRGPGYRIYFSVLNNKKLLLLGGSKKTQQQDILKAQQYALD